MPDRAFETPSWTTPARTPRPAASRRVGRVAQDRGIAHEPRNGPCADRTLVLD